jgi:hypothetical protein
MKFSAAQLEFLMQKLTVDDSFIQEAADFVPQRRVRAKPGVDKVLCSGEKKDGSPCKFAALSGGVCKRHTPKIEKSDATVEESE